MKIFTTSLLAATLSALLASGAAIANQGYATYTFPIKADTTLNKSNKEESVMSQSYWREVTGAELRKGIDLNTTAKSALVLLSLKGSQADQKVIDTDQLQLISRNGRYVDSKKVSQESLAQTGLFARSVAITAKHHEIDNDLTLRSNQAFNDDDRFIVTVKESSSPYQLKLRAPTQNITDDQDVLATFSFTEGKSQIIDRSTLSDPQYKAQLVAPDGAITDLIVESANEQLQVKSPALSTVLSPVHGLYEVQVTMDAKVDGKQVLRNAKVAVAMKNTTAQLVNTRFETSDTLRAIVSYEAIVPSRFEARAVLYGTNHQGKLVPVAEAHAAHDVNSGKQMLILPFNEEIVNAAGVKAPYEVGMVRLFDQGQLALLDTSDSRVSSVDEIQNNRPTWR
ncbi:DUF4785 family protein [Aestuariibacter sp. AA17]|uniref:DUF4785 family protein n=1 Tax=Fluctibacter corallii TaxID=2984329 RepID=A0ABT3A7D0_9ALTE|nr:DUF4785 family protein [Aestuariibacter sp. AA17]MCV2884595.1 DUF4785 family protein [Aestuariibacter sp. AA17]